MHRFKINLPQCIALRAPWNTWSTGKDIFGITFTRAVEKKEKNLLLPFGSYEPHPPIALPHLSQQYTSLHTIPFVIASSESSSMFKLSP